MEEDPVIREMDFSELMVEDLTSEQKKNKNSVLGLSQKDVTAAYFKHISLQDRKALYDIYKYDFDLFGYHPDPSIISV